MQFSHNMSSRTISLSQPGYIVNSMTRLIWFDFDTSSKISFPTSPMYQLYMQDPLPVPLTPSQQNDYMQIVGSVLFIFIDSIPSRPILFGQLSFPIYEICNDPTVTSCETCITIYWIFKSYLYNFMVNLVSTFMFS